MLQRNLTILTLSMLALSAGAQEAPEAPEAPEVPFFMPTPEGWRTETIPFPLGFAPELAYEGLEEIRFAPGMFEEGAEDFWSYAFVWWVPSATSFDAETLSKDLENYFRGLSQAVAQGRGFDTGEAVFAASIEAQAADEGSQRFAGRVQTLDAFATRRPIELDVRIEIWACEGQERRVAFFSLSPQPPSHAIWQTLHSLREGFRCES